MLLLICASENSSTPYYHFCIFTKINPVEFLPMFVSARRGWFQTSPRPVLSVASPRSGAKPGFGRPAGQSGSAESPNNRTKALVVFERQRRFFQRSCVSLEMLDAGRAGDHRRNRRVVRAELVACGDDRVHVARPIASRTVRRPASRPALDQSHPLSIGLLPPESVAGG